MCGCLALALGAMFPRIALVLLWFFSDWIDRAFSGEWLIPVIGVLLLPYTTLAYVALYAWTGTVEGFSWFIVALAFLGDIGAYASGSQARRTSPSA
ncbi:MAG: hypothetical protein CMH41_03090 [Micrococcales bacterium]|nr:hypothetical protein [Micrococcales bacterium]